MLYKINNIFFLIAIVAFLPFQLEAGNPDRQGEAGAYELLMNPWARSAGLHTMSTSMIRGVEALRLNPAGLARINSTEVLFGHSRYLEGTELRMNAFGLAQKVGEGTGATFSPNFFNLGLAYAHTFDNKISVGITLRLISETIADLSAFGFGIDAGVQYVTGPADNFKFGISLRNIGSRMSFGGQGLSFPTENPDGTLSYDITVNQRSAEFELPSVLNIGMSYDINVTKDNRITVLGNFTANSFARDQLGAGVEYSLKDMFMLRAAYKVEVGLSAAQEAEKSVYSGLSAGVSVEVPMRKQSENRFGIDYAYRATQPFSGTHNIAVRITL